MNIKREIRQRLDSHIELAKRMKNDTEEIEEAVRRVVETFRNGGKILIAGNGGSAADAQHWAAEWVIRLSHDIRRKSLPAIALTTDGSILTAGGNDLGFEHVFARQVEGLGKKGDLLILVSTSGKSANLVLAAETAHKNGMEVLGILGKDGGELKGICDCVVQVPSDNTQSIQEMQGFIGHQLCELSERILFADSA